ncbi:hypothetical protein GPECTOR_91g579 [Gonium pectorale]|uniref:CAF1B/HIR1 beta-propeller domain-containing protein n=1 Tax=Gonium pectorale TaxID=33097 RepID=A0A150G1Q7_GONPE|nr:hypothetical protein GPECTOR_91g579 [Gonium pectorale]|eukprot:KXZ43425.1 hypothetical protein GPECTOR_91g579 [Gonium pectorale]
MQLKTLQIVWHSKEPVLSVDFQPNSHTLVSGGQDGEVKHWEVVSEEDGSPGVRFLSSCPVNSKSVNCVRFSPTGDMLASAGDKGEVLLWRFAAFASGGGGGGGGGSLGAQRGNLDGVEVGAAAPGGTPPGLWRQAGALRGHSDDVLDLAWAPDGSALLSGGIENNVIVWDVDGKKSLKWLQDHGHYVQGVAWDPLGRFIASQSADRTARVYAAKPPPGLEGGGNKRGAAAAAAALTSAALAREGFFSAATLAKCPLLGGGGGGGAGAGQQQAGEDAATAPAAAAGSGKQPLFSDDSLPTFFRRLAWSPDGSFLAAPAGVFRAASTSPVTSTTHIFSRGDWSGPAVSLPCLSKGALVVRFCPRLFRAPPPPQQQHPGQTPSAAAAAPGRLPYRVVLAVASVDSVLLYDMQPGASPGRRRIVPVRVEAPPAVAAPTSAPPVPTLAPLAVVAAPGPAIPVGQGLSPLPSAARVEVGPTAAAAAAVAGAAPPSRTPPPGGSGGGVMVVPGVGAAAPESAIKMPTPQVLMFGTPPTAALREDSAAAGARQHPHHQQQQDAGAGAATGATAQAQQLPARAPKRLTPVPVVRCQRPSLDGLGTQQPQATAAAQPPASGPVAAAAQQPSAGAAVPSSAPAAQAATGPAAAAPAAAPAAGGRFSVAQLAAMRGAAAARKAAGS